MWEMAFQNIWQRKTRSILTVLGVGMAVMLYVYFSTIMNFYDADLRRTLAGFAGKVVVQARTEEEPRFPPAGSVLPADEADAILQWADVDPERSSAVLVETLVANPAPSMPPSVMAVGIAPGRESAFRGNTETAGAPGLTGPNQVILGAKAAVHYQKAVGDTLTIRGRDFQVVGIMDKANELLDGAVLLPLETAREIFVRPGVASAVLLTARQADRAGDLAAEIAAQYPQLAASSSAEMAKSANEVLAAQRAFFGMIRGMVIFVSLMVITIVMVMGVAERRKEIGTLKALGAGGGSILTLILAEAVTLTVAGGIAAITGAWFLTRGEGAPVDLRLALHSLVMAALVGLLAALWPAWSAQRVDPTESLRYE